MKRLFRGKNLFISLPLFLLFGLLFFPYFVGLLLSYFAFKKIENKKIKWITIFSIILVALYWGSTFGKPQTSSQVAKETPKVLNAKITDIPAVKSGEVSVVKVVDGDTLTVSLNGKNETIRIIGINTPETVDPRKPVECFGKQASEKAKELLASGTVRLEADPTQGERDKYGRLLRYIWFDQGTKEYGGVMIASGYAYEYTYQTPYKYQVTYKQLQKTAEVKKVGLWGEHACEEKNIPLSTTPGISVTPHVSVSQESTGDKDCKDFKTHEEAQAYFNSRGGSSANNVDNLDGADRDGVVCESLP